MEDIYAYGVALVNLDRCKRKLIIIIVDAFAFQSASIVYKWAVDGISDGNVVWHHRLFHYYSYGLEWV